MRKTYKYIIELDKPVWPRHIVDELIGRFGKVRDAKLLSVKDLQYKKHVYGDTYKVSYGDSDIKKLQEQACLRAWLDEEEE